MKINNSSSNIHHPNLGNKNYDISSKSTISNNFTNNKNESNVEIFDDPVKLYLSEIGTIKLLTSLEEKQIARSIEVNAYLQHLYEDYFIKFGKQPSPSFVTELLVNSLIDSNEYIFSIVVTSFGGKSIFVLLSIITSATCSSSSSSIV